MDSSVWIDWLRDVPGPATKGLDTLLDSGAQIATTEPVVMELLAGAHGSRALDQIGKMLTGLPVLSVATHLDFHHAAALYRDARSGGRTVRKLMDCLIGAVALRNDAILVHKDADFDAIADLMQVRWVSYC
ncbi:PIN domain nuclease [Actinopolymorpha sp. B11F2]|uniref:type II toxin-antitoxin system VapC family toxin n=1 Tax=Actinopolymorpha sp. B11F2 TaxID=3160862 RepID=UPI0032E38B6B